MLGSKVLLRERLALLILFFVFAVLLFLWVYGGDRRGGSSLLASGGNLGEPKGSLTLPISRDSFLNNLDPASWNGPIILHRLLYEGLLEEGPDHSLRPSLAEAWEISPDGLEYVFYLRKDVFFSSGDPFDAKAALFNLKRWTNDELFSALSASKTESLEILGTHVIKIRFREASDNILRELAYPRPVRFVDPKAVSFGVLGTFGQVTRPIGTGPFMLKSHNPEEFVLVPNPYHHGKAPRLSEIRFKIIKDGGARLMALKTGELDLAGGDLVGSIPLESLKNLKEDPRFDFHETPTLGSVFIAFNNDSGIFDKKALRAAISYSIDRRAIMEDLFDGQVGEASGLFQKGVPYASEENNFVPPYDPRKASELFYEAGYEKRGERLYSTKDGSPLSLVLLLTADENPEWKALSEYIQSSLTKAGAELRINLTSRNSYYDSLNYKRDKFDLAISRTYSDLWMPHGFLKEFFTELPGQKVARFWTDPEYEDLANKASQARDEETRKALYHNIMFHISDDYLTVPLYFQESLFFTNKEKVLNFKAGTSVYEPVDWVTLEAR